LPTKSIGSIALFILFAVTMAWTQSQDPATLVLGKRVFEGKAGGALCFTCHGMNGKGAPGLGPDLTDDKWLPGDGSVAFIDSLVRAGVAKPKQSAAPMPPMGGAKLSDAQVAAVVAYVQSLRKA
jgi:mono/diheme cytochrome c family protein